MKPVLPLLLIIAVFFLQSNAFSQAMEGKTEYQKGDKVAAFIELPYQAEIIENAIEKIMDKKGVKSDHSKGFDIYRNARIKDGDQEMSDLHFKVERKSRKEKETTVIYLIVGKPGENVAVRTSDDNYKVGDAKEFLNRIAPSIDAYNLELQIQDQQETVKKSEKKLQNLEEDQKDLEKKIKSLQDKLEENKNDQKKQSDETGKQKSMLASMEGRRKG